LLGTKGYVVVVVVVVYEVFEMHKSKFNDIFVKIILDQVSLYI